MPADLRRGFSILELIVALTLLGATGTAIVAAIGQTHASMTQALAAEVRVRRASRLLNAIAREPRAPLERRAGRRRVEGYEVRVGIGAHELIGIALADTGTGAILVETVVHRPRRRSDAP